MSKFMETIMPSMLYEHKDSDIAKNNIKYLLDKSNELERIVDEVSKENDLLKDEIKKLKRQIEIKDEYCKFIWMFGCDYDGCKESEDLKQLIDELVKYANRAINNDDTSVFSIGGISGEELNILGESIGGECK